MLSLHIEARARNYSDPFCLLLDCKLKDISKERTAEIFGKQELC